MASEIVAPAGLAQDWEATWREGVAQGSRWDIAGPYKPLAKLVASNTLPAGKSLVPGCGRGYDVISLASLERCVIGLDLAPTAVQEAEAYLRDSAAEKKAWCKFQVEDFFTHRPAEPYAVIFDYTMLCATLPSRCVVSMDSAA